MKRNPSKGTYPNNIAYQMTNHNKARDEVAFLANISRTVFVSLIQGKRPMNKHQARRLAKAIGCQEQDLFVTKEVAEQPTVTPIAAPVVNEVPKKVEAIWKFNDSEINELTELVQREIGFLRSTGRNIAADRMSILVSKLGTYLSNPASVALDNSTSSVISMTELADLTNSQPAQKSSKKTMVKKLSRPWDKDELANVLSALRNGMSNEEAAKKTERPLDDIANTKVLFGWMWHKKQPAKPSKADVDRMLFRVSESTRDKMFVTAQLSNV